MSREQVQIPIGGTGESSEKERENAPKGLNRPAMPQGLEKPKPLARKKLWLRRRCNCGRWTCRSPATGTPSGYYWVYFDTEGNEVNARANGLPITGDHDGSTMGIEGTTSGIGWANGTSPEEFKAFNSVMSSRLRHYTK